MSVTTKMQSLLGEAVSSPTYLDFLKDAEFAFLSAVAERVSKKVSSKLVKVTPKKAISMSMLDIEGTTRSDIEINGYVSLIMLGNDVQVIVQINHAQLGKIEDEAKVKVGVLSAQMVADMVLRRLE